jgi:hypothetical protein
MFYGIFCFIYVIYSIFDHFESVFMLLKAKQGKNLVISINGT